MTRWIALSTLLWLGSVQAAPNTQAAPVQMPTSTQTAPSTEPWPQAYGFNWLQPEKAQCEQLKPATRQRFKDCSYLAEGGFDGSTTSYLCTQDEQHEYMLFIDAATCHRQLDTMMANAP